MKRKLFFLLVFIFGVCGVFGSFELNFSYVQASSPSASVWDGQLDTDNVFVGADGSTLTVGSGDWYNEGNDYYINSAKGLAHFANSVNGDMRFNGANVYLETDIDWSGKSWKLTGAFNGNFYGQGHTIFNLNIGGGADYAGFFSVLGASSTISNLHLRKFSINTSAKFTGGLVGWSSGLNLANCSVQGNITVSGATDFSVGGLVGCGASALTNCYANTNIIASGTNGNVGGLVGSADNVSVSSTFNQGTIASQNCTSTNIGGLVGALNGTGKAQIANSYNTASILSNATVAKGECVGGLVGRVSNGQAVTIDHSYNSGNITYNLAEGNFFGGLIGNSSSANLALQNCFAVGKISSQTSNAETDFVNAIANGQASKDHVYFESASTNISVGAVANLSALARTREFYRNTTYFSTDWDFETAWKISSINNGLPYLDLAEKNNDSDTTFDKNSAAINLRGEGTAKAPYLIETAGDLAYLSEIVAENKVDGQYFSLQNDIDLTGRTWIPIGYLNAFRGVFDGNGHSIFGLTSSLQEDFVYVGLFGQTENAVIKNLTMGSVRNLVNNSSDSNAATGTLIGHVAANTYLVNCVDASNAQDEYGRKIQTVGSVLDGQLFVGYGRRHASANGTIQTNTLALSNVDFTEVYDVAISGDGGTFYDTIDGKTLSAENVYMAEYHILMQADGTVGKICLPVATNGEIIDETFGKTVLPQLSSKIGSADVLYKRGYLLTGYRFSNNDLVSYDSSQNLISNFLTNNGTICLALRGLEAVWKETSVPVKVVYNQYEIANLNALNYAANYGEYATIDGNYPIEIGGVGGQQVYVYFLIPYDTFLSEFDYIYDAPNNLRDGKFKIKSLWTDFVENDFAGTALTREDDILMNFGYAAGDQISTWYAQWIENERSETSNTVTFNFVTDEDINLADVLSKVTMSGNKDGNFEEISTLTTTQSASNGSRTATFAYDVSYSTSKNEWLSFEVDLAPGFMMAGDPSITRSGIGNNPNAQTDTNFGRLTTTSGLLSASTDGVYYIRTSKSMQTELCNLVGDYTINIDIKKEVYVDNLNVQGDVSLGISPKENFVVTANEDGTFSSNVSVQVRDGMVYNYVDVLSLLALTDEELQNLALQTEEKAIPLYIAFDVANNLVLFSSNQYDAKPLMFENYTYNTNFSFRFSTANGMRNFTLSNDVWGEQQGILLKENGTNLLQLVRENDRFVNMKYVAFSSFVAVASTESDNANFTACDYIPTEAHKLQENSQVARTHLRGENDNSKYLIEFENIVQDNQDVSGSANTFNVISQYTQASFDFEFVYGDGTQIAQAPANFASQRPIAFFENASGNFDVSAGGQIVFYVQSTDYYKFIENAIKLFAGGEYNIKIVASDVNYSLIQNEGESDEDFAQRLENATRNYENAFNQDNTDYLQNASIQLFNKGAWEGDIQQFSADTYKITLQFNSNIASNGLQAGKYVITLVCSDEEYSIDFATKFVSADDVEGKGNSEIATDILNRSIALTDERGADVLTSVAIEEDEKTSVSTGDVATINSLIFSNSLTLNTFTNNDGYIFKGWWIETEGIAQLYSSSELKTLLSQIYRKNDIENTDNHAVNKTLTAYAVYVKKKFNLILNGNLTLQNENGTEGFATYSASSRALTLSMSSNGVDLPVYTYDYSISNSVQNILLTLGGNNRFGYYFAGYEIYDGMNNRLYQREENVSENDQQNGTMSIDLQWMKQEIEMANILGGTEKQTYYLQPIIKQKKAQIYFHSGTGGEGNQFGDTFNGEVFDESGASTSASVFAYGVSGVDIFFGNTVNISDGTLNLPNSQTFNLELFLLQNEEFVSQSGKTIGQLFATRKGYTWKNTYFWGWKSVDKDNQTISSGILPLSSLALTADLFRQSSQTAKIHLYIIWQPNTYIIRYESNDQNYFGTATGSTSDTIATYDAQVTFAENNFHLTGYKFVGWNTQADGQGQSFSANSTVFRPNLCTGETGQESVTLYAIWQAREYQVEINFNSGKLDEEQSKIYTLQYNQTFAQMNDGSTDISIESIVPQREGFTLAGFYVQNNINQSAKVENETAFNTTLLSAVFAEYEGDQLPIAVTLYAVWDYVSDFVSLALKDNSQSATYNGSEQAFFVSTYFNLDNIDPTNTNGIAPVSNDGTLNFEVDVIDILYQVSLVSTSAALQVSPNNFSFRVREAGDYSLRYTITITDNSQFFNRGVLQTLTIYLRFVMNKAEFSVVVDDDVKTLNAKRIMAPFVNFEGASIENLQELAAFIQKTDESAIGAENEEIYEFVMTKYYLLFMTNNGQQHKTYKEWKYSDFVEYRQNNQEEVKTILSNLQFFNFFDFSSDFEIEEYLPHISFSSTQPVSGFGNDIVKTTVAAYSLTGVLQARNLYELRVYLDQSENIENYAVSHDNMGYYVVVGTAYILPKAFVATNISANVSTYYSENYTDSRIAEWIYDGQVEIINGFTYYKIGEIGGNALFAYAQLCTSNAGLPNQTIQYSYKDNENYLYFSNVSVRLQAGETMVDYSSNFKFVLEDENVFSILKTSDVLYLTMSAKYLTIDSGTRYCDDITPENFNLSDLQNIPTNLLNISRVYYNFGAETDSFADCAGQNRFVDSETGILIYEILINNANVVNMYINSAVTAVQFVASTKMIGEYISLYTWQEGEYENRGVDETISVDDSFIYEIKVEPSEESLTTINLNAIYTDLVNVKFDYNFPENYDGVSENYIRLNHTTADNFEYPTVAGLEIASVRLEGFDIDLLTNPQAFFTGDGGAYVGMSLPNIRTPLKFSVMWQVEQIRGLPLMEDYRTAVSSFEQLFVSDVVELYNFNEEIYNYTYQWFKQDDDGIFEFAGKDGVVKKYSLLTTQDTLTLQQQGSFFESGEYKLRIFASLKNDLRVALVDDENFSSSLDVDFELHFMQNILQDVQLPENVQVTYDNRDHINDWRVRFAYQVYDSWRGDYVDNLPYEQGYAEEGAIFFEVYLNDEKVTEMKNAGTYTIFIRFQDGKFDLSNFDGDLSFNFAILPFQLDLQDYDLNTEKVFNGETPTFDKTIVVNGESVVIGLHTNEQSEDVGRYDLFLNAQQNNNFIFKFAGKTLYESGNDSLSQVRESTAVGAYTIKTSGVLRLSYQGDLIREDFVEGGYSLQLTKDFRLLIVRNFDNMTVRDLQLSLYDSSMGSQISNEAVLAILSEKFSDLTAQFSSNTISIVAENCGTYNYVFEMGEEFAKYFSSVEMAQEFVFEILPIVIDVSTLKLEKTFDGTNQLEVAQNGVEIVATFASVHVGDNIAVDLRLKNANANFQLSSLSSTGKITPLAAVLTLKMSAESYVYGEVSTANLASLVSVEKVLADGKDVTNLLQNGYYTLNLSLAGEENANARGMLYKGSYTVDGSLSQFADFDMTVLDLSFQVNAREFVAQIPENYITISTKDTLADTYVRAQVVTETGDEVQLTLRVVHDETDWTDAENKKLKAGKYALDLVSATDNTLGSVLTSVPENLGFSVVAAEQTLIVSIDSLDILRQEYNGVEFSLSVDANNKLVISNDIQTFESLLTFSVDGVSVDASTINFQNISILYGEASAEFRNVGTYILSLQASVDSYANVLFDQQYNFVVTPRTIDPSALQISKVYDMNTLVTISSFNEKVAGDDVLIVADFADANAGTNKNVTLKFLQGEARGNYQFVSTAASGTIEKAVGTITLSQTEFAYGELSRENSALARYASVVSGGAGVAQSQYKLSITLKDGQYSELGFLTVGQYDVEIADTLANSNYQIAPLQETITIVPYQFSIAFEKDGEIKLEHGTSLADTQVPYSIASTNSPLREKIDFVLQRNSTSSAIGKYRIIDGAYTSLDGNYVATVTDESTNGAFEITATKSRIYVMFKEAENVRNDLIPPQIEMTYDGNFYDSVMVEKEDGQWKLVVYNSANANIRQSFALAFFTLQDGEYVAYDSVEIEGLSTNIRFRNSGAFKNVGTYQIRATETTSSTSNNMWMGKEGTEYAFNLKVVPADVYFRSNAATESGQNLIQNNTILQGFTGKEAIYSFQDNGLMLDGIVGGDTVTLNVRFLDESGKVAKYVGARYQVEATLEDAQNYVLHATTRPAEGGSGTTIIGRILPANISVVINNQTFTYGNFDLSDVEYQFQTDIEGFNFEQYFEEIKNLENPRNFNCEVRLKNADYSSSNNLNAGEYDLDVVFSADDFAMSGELSAKVKIMQKTLSLAEKDLSLQEIFTKRYDGTTVANIFAGGQLLFDLHGIVLGDDVTVASAEYAAPSGQNLQVTFTLESADANKQDWQNYVVETYVNGIILDVAINLQFNYDKEKLISNVTDNGLSEISTLSYPFTSNGRLTSNSANPSTASERNFPTSLRGNEGFNFAYWTMDFENVTAAQEEFLSSLVSLLNLTKVEKENIFSIRVGNDSATVGLLRALIEDQSDVFGKYFYQTHQDITIAFNPNWTTMQHNFSIRLTDENGQINSALGQLTIEVDGQNFGTIDASFRGLFDHGSAIVLRAKANTHCTCLGFYVAGNRVESGVDSDGNVIYTISSLASDFNIDARFETQRVNVVLDLSAHEDATFSSSNFVPLGGGRYRWATDYFALQDITLSNLPSIAKTGYNFVGFEVNGSSIALDDFATTTIISLLPNEESGTLSINFAPIFNPVQVEVTLDFGYDNLVKTIYVSYNETYNSAEGWQEEITQVGHTFAGWKNSDNQIVTGQSILSNLQPHTLTAQWNIKKYSVTLSSAHADITNSNVVFSHIGSTYTASDVEYGSQVTFQVDAHTGYEIRTQQWWSEEFVLTINQDGHTFVTLTIPDCDVNFEIPVLPLQNNIAISGQNTNVKVFDVTEEKTEIEISNSNFAVETGRKIRFEVTAAMGYAITEEVFINDTTNLQISKTLSGETLIVEIDGINHNFSIEFVATETFNNISFDFSNIDAIEVIEIGGVSYEPSKIPTFQVLTGMTLEFFLKLNFGYQLGTVSSSDFFVEQKPITESGYDGYLKFEISDVHSNGRVQVVTNPSRFTIKTEVITYSPDHEIVDVEANKAFVDLQTSKEVDFLQFVTLSYETSTLYHFAGWSKDGQSIFSTQQNLSYQVQGDETIYAIFSAQKNDVVLATMEYREIYREYSDPNKLERQFNIINLGKYYDGVSGEEISSFEIYYGATVSIKFDVPDGFMYYGFGYMQNQEFVFLDREIKTGSQIDVTISSFDLADVSINTLYMVVTSYSVTLDVYSKVDLDNVLVADNKAGDISLSNAFGESVNQFGYVDGTRVHYGTHIDERQFSVISYTSESVFLKVAMQKEGYQLEEVRANLDSIRVTNVLTNEEFSIFRIDGLVGGTQGIEIDVVFKPMLNTVEISFAVDGLSANGGALQAKQLDDLRKIWTSGNDYSSISVSAYTDSDFMVTAYIKAGFLGQYSIEDLDGVVDIDSITFEALSVEDTGFVAKLTFIVREFFNHNTIKIILTPQTYTVALRDGTQVLAKIKNVAFTKALDLSQANAENIEIFDERVSFENGMLNVVLRKSQHNFEGYFTYQNGAGVQYINSSGFVTGVWMENGYEFDSVTSKFKLGTNARFDEDGDIEFSLYLYQSYLKTRIQFEFEPAINGLTAMDMLTGIDNTNSWFYPTNPNYIEVAFNSDIYITAPEIDGYKFYKFVINQKASDGTSLSEITSFSPRVPWSTNEFDSIVEVRIQVVYYAQVQVTVSGGEGKGKITQEGSDQALLEQGFVDTTKSFEISAVADEGFDFAYWYNQRTGQLTRRDTLTLSTTQKLSLVLGLVGKQVTLDFSEYIAQSSQNGQISNISILSLDGSVQNRPNNETFPSKINVKVGDKVTLSLRIDSGFAVTWNRDDIIFDSYINGRYLFVLNIAAADVGKTIPIVPTFRSEVLSVYIQKYFNQNLPNAIDGNYVEFAGKVLFDGKELSSFIASPQNDLRLDIFTNPRYAVSKVTIKNNGKVFDDMSEFMTEDGSILLTAAFLAKHEIIGMLNVDIEFERLLWDDFRFESEMFGGNGTVRNPYTIYTLEDLILMMKFCNTGQINPLGLRYGDCSYVLMADLNLTERFWTPIGTNEFPFNGTFDFNGHKITGIYNAQYFESLNFNGLFGVLGSGANIFTTPTPTWWIYLIVGLVLLLIAIIVLLILVNRNKKKQREEMAKR